MPEIVPMSPVLSSYGVCIRITFRGQSFLQRSRSTEDKGATFGSLL